MQRHTEPTPSLSQALEKIQAIGQHVNETKRLVDRIAELLVVQGHLANSLPHDQEKVFGAGILYAPHRRLIREGELKVRGKSLLGSDKSRKYYLLNDLLLWTNASHKYKSHMMLLYAQVNEAASPVEEHPLAFEITKFQLSTDSGEARMQQMEKYLLYAASNAERNAWVKDIGIAIQEATALQAAAAPLSAAGVSSSGSTGGANGTNLAVPHAGDRVRRASEGVMQGVFAELHSVAGNKQSTPAGKQRGGSSTIDEEGLHTPSMPPPPPAELSASVFSSSDGAGASPPRGNHRSSQSHMTPLPNGGGLLALPTTANATAASGTPSAPASGRNSPAPPAAASTTEPSPPPTPTPATPPPIAKRPSLSRPGSIKHTKSPSTPSAPTSASATGGSHSRHGSMGAHTAAAASAAGTSSGSHSRQQSTSTLHTRQASMGRHTAKQPSAHALAIAADASDNAASRSHSKNPSASTPVAPAEDLTADSTVAASSSRPSTPPPAAAAVAVTPSSSPGPQSNGDTPSSAHSRSASLAANAHSRSSSRSHFSASSVVSPVISAVVNGAHYDHSANQQASNPTLPSMPPPLSAEEAAAFEGAPAAAAPAAAAPAAAASAPPVPPRPLHIRHSSGSSSEATITVHSTHGGAEELKDASGSSEAPSPLESEWATASACMAAMTRNDVTALKMLKTPTPNVKAALECLAVLLLAAPAAAPVAQTPRGAAAAAIAQKKSAALPEKTDDWAQLQSLWVKVTFLKSITEFNERRPATPVPEALERRLRKLTADPTMSVEAVSKASPAAGVLWRWVLSYCHLFGMGGPGPNAGVGAAPKPAGLSSSASVSALKAPRASMPPAAAAASAGRPASARPSHTRSHSAGGGKRIILPLNEASIAAALADAEAASAASSAPSSKIPVTPRSAAAASKAAPGSAPGVGARAISITPHRAAAGAAGAAPGSATARPLSAAGKPGTAPPLPPRRVSQSAHMSKEEVASILAGARSATASPAGTPRGSFSSPAGGSATARSASSSASGPGSAPSKVASRLAAPSSGGGGLLKSAKPLSMASPGGAGAPMSPAPGSAGSRPGSAAGTPITIKRTPSAAALALTTPPSSSAAAAAPSSSSSSLSKVSPTVPRAADAARHTPGGGRVKIFSEKTDYSKVTSKVPSADVTGVAPPKPGVPRTAASAGAGAGAGAGGVSKKLDMNAAGSAAAPAKKPASNSAAGAPVKKAASSESH